MFFEGQFAHVCVGSPPVKYVYLQLAIATSIYVALSPHVKCFEEYMKGTDAKKQSRCFVFLGAFGFRVMC